MRFHFRILFFFLVMNVCFFYSINLLCRALGAAGVQFPAVFRRLLFLSRELNVFQYVYIARTRCTFTNPILLTFNLFL